MEAVTNEKIWQLHSSDVCCARSFLLQEGCDTPIISHVWKFGIRNQRKPTYEVYLLNTEKNGQVFFLTLDHFFLTLPLFFDLGSLFFDLGSLFSDLDLLFLNLGMFLFNLGLLPHTCLEPCAILHFFSVCV